MSAAPRSTPNRQSNLPQQACRNLSPSSRVNTVLYHSAHRRNSDGNYTTPTQIILRVPHPPSPIMEVCHRATRSQSLRTQETVYCRRSLSPTRVDLGSVTRGFDDEGSLSLQSGSGSSTYVCVCCVCVHVCVCLCVCACVCMCVCTVCVCVHVCVCVCACVHVCVCV